MAFSGGSEYGIHITFGTSGSLGWRSDLWDWTGSIIRNPGKTGDGGRKAVGQRRFPLEYERYIRVLAAVPLDWRLIV